MPNATARANAQAMPDEPKHASPDQLAARIKFEAAYSDWLAARSATCDPALDESDAVANERDKRLRDAEFALVGTRAPYGWAVMQKLEFVEGLVANDYEAGKPAYPLAILALASVKADMLAIGFWKG